MSFRRWLPTFLGFPIGGYLATQIVGSLHDPASAAAGGLVADVMLWGLVTGATVGAAQSALLATGPRVAAAWAAVNAVGWSLGWLVTSGVIVDIERGHHVFGSSGALLATLLTGLALRQLLAAARPAAALSV